MMKELHSIGSNLNQIAARANAIGHIDCTIFQYEAKRYGVLYCALRDKKSLDGMCDIMVRVEDASKINRIVERFKLGYCRYCKHKERNSEVQSH
ncbi:MAG: PcfB family protein [Acetivibrionales bacterium]